MNQVAAPVGAEADVVDGFWDGVWVGAFVALAVAGAVWMFTAKGGWSSGTSAGRSYE